MNYKNPLYHKAYLNVELGVKMKTLSLILGLGLLCSYPLIADAQPRSSMMTVQDQTDIPRIETYLNSLHTLTARFIQTTSNGKTSYGKLWLERPGRMRLQYDPPANLLLVASNGLAVFHDADLDQTSKFPLSSTPLSLILAEDIRLLGKITVTHLLHSSNQTQMTVLRTDKPMDGSLTLVFDNNPLALRSWTIMDAQRQLTTVSLSNMQMGGTFNQSLFTFVDPN
jgi:outer membrane lipoprotein-sorting protein